MRQKKNVAPKLEAKKVKSATHKSIKVHAVELGISDVLSAFDGVVTLPIKNANGHALVEGVLSSAKPEELFRKVLQEQVGHLMGRVNEVRTERSVSELTLKTEMKSHYDDQWLEISLHAKVDTTKQPDLPAMTSAMAKTLLETAFGHFPVRIELNGDQVEFSQSEPIWVCDGMVEGELLSPLPTDSVQQLYINAAHNICAAVLEDDVTSIRYGQNGEWIRVDDWLETWNSVQLSFEKADKKKKPGAKRVK